MKTEKMKIAEQARFESAKKWGEYEGPFTPEIIQQMHDENERIKELCDEATKEWLQMKMEGKDKCH